jgi:hypothetical protein
MKVHRLIHIAISMAFLFVFVTIGIAQPPNSPELSKLITSGKIYRHSVGFTFRHPTDWQAQPTESGIALIPISSAGETYLIISEEVEGISRPDAPQIIQALQQQIATLAPFLQRTGEINPVLTGCGPGVRLTWEGRNPNGVDVRTRLFVVIFENHAIYFVATAARDRIEIHDALLHAIFSTVSPDSSVPSATANPLDAQSKPLSIEPLDANGYVGTFKNDQMEIKLTGKGQQYTGTIHFNGQQLRATAQETQGRLEGMFQSQGNHFAFTALLKGTTLTFSTGGATYMLEKQILNPLAATKPTNPLAMPQPATLPSVSKKMGKTYRHPIGFTFWYPEHWQVQDTELGLQLIPPDIRSNAQGPTEAFLILGDSADGISRPDDPRVIQYLESQLVTGLPFLKRIGEVESVDGSGGPGALITWEGKNPSGMQVRARVFTILLHGYGVALVAVGDTDGVNAREPVLRKIFSTFGFGESEKDRRLIGTWQYESTYFSGDFSGTTIRHMIFQADGAFRSGTRLLASSDAGTADSGEGSGEHGQWSAGNETLYLIWDDGSITEYGYYIEGPPGEQKMLLKPADGSKKELWEQIR